MANTLWGKRRGSRSGVQGEKATRGCTRGGATIEYEQRSWPSRREGTLEKAMQLEQETVHTQPWDTGMGVAGGQGAPLPQRVTFQHKSEHKSSAEVARTTPAALDLAPPTPNLSPTFLLAFCCLSVTGSSCPLPGLLCCCLIPLFKTHRTAHSSHTPVCTCMHTRRDTHHSPAQQHATLAQPCAAWTHITTWNFHSCLSAFPHFLD